ncbi:MULTISPECIES: chromosomal replication initiator protein DnaA [Furfurilactobacillus]|uniref:Chromosomal replication initiator protein DnaA n=2 Tax=Furfurilactobacillus TaxID=2767882 RepID=A0ABT6DAE6_9LACO|nr:chromosomal replication initiator protein DnaA [Furfurilactobacillus milii]QLE65354.1 Chromosomal replication initiator protein DnaA [Furfurilactobacillus rossiae]MCF6160403.1 chromosomal replication initiator protein DnaA [Furfurilactobacillus milii]MCF6162635.1 chromosomal replication initiator protein DnaA [Furfurilactobacillus milii]MDF9914099.1 chromosomal replication initiator protein DnaA [Furfurilactobacillus milii]MYV05858.1 chromosomal replication initiator protein DnaA [Furfurila
MVDKNTLWDGLKESFRANLSPVTFNTWVESALPLSYQPPRFVLQVPSQLHKDYWERTLTPKLVEFAFSDFQAELEPEYVIEGEQPAQPTVKEPVTDTATTEVANHANSLNDKYTFDTFVIGKGNQMANAAAMAVSEEPGTLYNPLFLYGGVGLGKTHLMHAIGHAMIARNPNTNVMYVTSEEFTNDMVMSIRDKTQEQFRLKYRYVDLLLVDDIQFFADKEGTQEEFFHTFEQLYNNSKQIVLTSDRLPNEIPKLQDRLVSRFKWGLSVDITAPDLETRIAILRNKAEREQIEIPDDALEIIASQVNSNVRELEGALARVQAYSRLQKKPIDEDLVHNALKSLNLESKPTLTIELIQQKVASYFDVNLVDLKGKKRMKEIVVPRQIAMYLARELTNSSLPKIGKAFGGKDHTTVLHSCDKIAESISNDAKLAENIQQLKIEIQR